MAVLLPLPDDPRFQAWIDGWPQNSTPTGGAVFRPFPRSYWLSYFEGMLLAVYPHSSSRDRSLTARHYFSGFLAAGHDVP